MTSRHRREVSPDERREAFERVYAEIPREELQRAARQRLDGDLRLAAGRWRRRFAVTATVIGLCTVFAAILAIVYLLELTRSGALRLGEQQGHLHERAIDHGE